MSLPVIADIRRGVRQEDLFTATVRGLRSTPKWLPSLLLWDEKGLQLFETITKSPYYYGTKAECEILQSRVDEIVRSVGNDGILIDLGSGGLHKTGIIISALVQRQKRVDYYALDVTSSEISRSLEALSSLVQKSSLIKCHGLLGSYDDLIPWLTRNDQLVGRKVTFLWLGNSIANLTPPNASSIMSKFASAIANSSIQNPQFIIGVDGCRDMSLISRAYDAPDGSSRAFVLNSIEHANRIIGRRVFNPADWAYVGEYNEEGRVWQAACVSKQDIQIRGTALVEPIFIREGERIDLVTSGKWAESDVKCILNGSGIKLTQTWKHPNADYSFYILQPEILTQGWPAVNRLNDLADLVKTGVTDRIG